MGDAQSAQRESEGKEDAVVDEEVVKVDDAKEEEIIEDKVISYGIYKLNHAYSCL